MSKAVEGVVRIEGEVMHDRFADFERGVLQDNIILCDCKSGVLLAFAGAMVIFSIDAFVGARHGHAARSWIATGGDALFLISATAFLASCHFALQTVAPRFRRDRLDRHIFWESAAYRLPVDEYVRHMMTVALEIEHHEKLRHLHLLAGICRNKFNHFQWSIRFGQTGFLLLVLAELSRLIA
jgi:hypothetical protein